MPGDMQERSNVGEGAATTQGNDGRESEHVQPRAAKQEQADPFQGPPSPQSSAGFFSAILFWWANPVFQKGYRRLLNPSDIFELPNKMSSESIMAKFDKAWSDELRSKGKEHASLGYAFFKAYKWDIIKSICLNMVGFTLTGLGPLLFLRNLIRYATMVDAKIGYGLAFAFGLLVSESARTCVMQSFWQWCVRYAIPFKAIVYGLVYRKALQLRDLGGYSVGELVNVSTNDGHRLFEAGVFALFIFLAVLQGILVMIATSLILGPATLAGCLIFFLMIPIQILFSKKTGALRRLAIHQTDQRVRTMSEILNCIKLIKMYAWETPFASKIKKIRGKERRILQSAGYWQSITISIVPVLPAVASVVTFLLQAYFGDGMSAEDVFTVLGLFNILRLAIEVLPRGVKARSEAKIGLHRLKNFILLDDKREIIPEPKGSEDVIVDFDDATLVWPAVKARTDMSNKNKDIRKQKKELKRQRTLAGNNQDVQQGKDKGEEGGEEEAAQQGAGRVDGKDHTVLTNVSLKLKQGDLVGVCGSVGSGKSTLLSALLGQIKIGAGSLGVRGQVAYVSQQAWIQSDTLKNNILFGKAMDPKLYKATIDCCSLRHDLSVLPGGEETEIGERGINLSGGQKQRISLARAIYADHDLYLLDDPLSAVDAHVGRSIFEDCIKGRLSRKTVLLVTHQLQYLPQCDRVCFLHEGKAFVGTHSELLKSNEDYKHLISHHHADEDTLETEEEEDAVLEKELSAQASTEAENAEKAGETKDGSLTTEEAVQEGHVTFRTYKQYARAGGGLFIFTVLIILFMAAMFAKAYSDFYLALWLRDGDGNSSRPTTDPGNPSDNPDLDRYALIFSMIVVGLIVMQGIRGYLFTFLTLKASTVLHNSLFRKIVRAPMHFFDTTPTGRMVNRFSTDMDIVDVQLAFDVERFVLNICLILATLGLIAYIFPYFLVALVPICIIYGYLVQYAMKTQRQMQRLTAVTVSPLISQLSATLQGIQTISAFGKNDQFMKDYKRKLDVNTKVFYGYTYVAAWFAVRLDLVTALIAFSVAIISVALHGNADPQLVGAAITYTLSFAGLFQYTTRLATDVEGRFTNAERIINYIDTVPGEPEFEKPLPPNLPQNWPSGGGIQFKGVEARYREHLEPVLRNVDLKIRPREKIGIVGRTGAGKSTIAMVIFRMMELSRGAILIDGVDITSVGSNYLRSRLSIIPQDPVLFVGTVRYNVDPFNEHSDAAIWHALEQAHIKPLVSSLEEGLEALVVENGENFSVGERQLLCMARALLRKSKILIMDEATAAIDTKTDALIQETIRKAFVDCTVLTIAHRLNTIMDSDRILVMADGEVAEFDHPQILMQDEESFFSKMLEDSGVTIDRSKPFNPLDYRVPSADADDSDENTLRNPAAPLILGDVSLSLSIV